jgi:hypothetical protein
VQVRPPARGGDPLTARRDEELRAACGRAGTTR